MIFWKITICICFSITHENELWNFRNSIISLGVFRCKSHCISDIHLKNWNLTSETFSIPPKLFLWIFQKIFVLLYSWIIAWAKLNDALCSNRIRTILTRKFCRIQHREQAWRIGLHDVSPKRRRWHLYNTKFMRYVTRALHLDAVLMLHTILMWWIEWRL